MEYDIKDYLEEEIPELSGRFYPVIVVDPDDGINIAYAFTDITRGHINRSQLTLTVISEDYDRGMAAHDKISDILAMEEDEPFRKHGTTRFRSELSSGGGRIYNEEIQRWELSKYYIIDWRNINEQK